MSLWQVISLTNRNTNKKVPTWAIKKIHHRIPTFITVQLFQLNIKSMKRAHFFMNCHLLGFSVQHAEISFFSIKPAGDLQLVIMKYFHIRSPSCICINLKSEFSSAQATEMLKLIFTISLYYSIFLIPFTQEWFYLWNYLMLPVYLGTTAFSSLL